MGCEYQNPVSFNFDISVPRRVRRIIKARIIMRGNTTANRINVLFSCALNDIYDNHFHTLRWIDSDAAEKNIDVPRYQSTKENN